MDGEGARRGEWKWRAARRRAGAALTAVAAAPCCRHLLYCVFSVARDMLIDVKLCEWRECTIIDAQE